MISTFQIPTDITSKISLVEHKMLDETDNYNPDLKKALQVLLSSGGKRIRPLIILLIGSMLNGPVEEIINLATAIELLHTATLVHDDLIDGSLLRRGVPTLNSHWSPAATILTGDFLFSRAASLAANTNHFEVIKLFSNTLSIIVNGEINQLFSSRCNPSKTDYFNKIYAKTSSLFETAAQSASILSRATSDQIEAFRKYGYSLGMAFQVVDDILDYVGDTTKVGKPVGEDLRQGLITMPMLYYIESNPTDKVVINLLNHKCIEDESELQRVINEIKSSDAIENSFTDARRFADQAINCLAIFSDGIYKDCLKSIAGYTVERRV